MTTTCLPLSLPRPSSSVSSWLSTLADASLPSPLDVLPLRRPKASISSKKITAGALALAILNSSRTLASDWPNHLLSSSGPFTDRKLAPLSRATALASSVLPQPGGPWSSTPLLACRLNLLTNSGWFNGRSMASFSSSLTASSPPMSHQDTLGVSMVYWASCRQDGLTTVRACSKWSCDTVRPCSATALLTHGRPLYEIWFRRLSSECPRTRDWRGARWWPSVRARWSRMQSLPAILHSSARSAPT
mmetsp:Transcript_45859/g.114023  ORF Transcript_45859/g.114023 Transcript_45859/m.114023 type:complete len:246 (+) Transcript_45859:2383-3120(+)